MNTSNQRIAVLTSSVDLEHKVNVKVLQLLCRDGREVNRVNCAVMTDQ